MPREMGWEDWGTSLLTNGSDGREDEGEVEPEKAPVRNKRGWDTIGPSLLDKGCRLHCLPAPFSSFC